MSNPVSKKNFKPLSPDDVLFAQQHSLLSFLCQKLSMADAQIEKLAGGYSNLTYVVTDTSVGTEYVLRMPPRGAAHIHRGHDMAREAKFLLALAPHYHYAPKVVFVEDDSSRSVIGVPFFVMEKRYGRVVRNTLGLPVDKLRTLSENMIRALAELHKVKVEDLGAPSADPHQFVTRQVQSWIRREEQSRTQEIPELVRMATWLQAMLPKTAHISVVHNDFKYDNVMVDIKDPTQVTTVLDWELASIGDSRCDIGTLLAYWIEEGDDDALKELPLGPTGVLGNLSRHEVLKCYQEALGHDVNDVLYFFVLGCFRVAVIAQQIFLRFQKSYTNDERFASLERAPLVIAQHACRALDANRIL